VNADCPPTEWRFPSLLRFSFHRLFSHRTVHLRMFLTKLQLCAPPESFSLNPADHRLFPANARNRDGPVTWRRLTNGPQRTSIPSVCNFRCRATLNIENPSEFLREYSTLTRGPLNSTLEAKWKSFCPSFRVFKERTSVLLDRSLPPPISAFELRGILFGLSALEPFLVSRHFSVSRWFFPGLPLVLVPFASSFPS